VLQWGEPAVLRKSIFAATFLTLLFLAGCASDAIGPERDLNDPTNSLVFAYIDMSDAPTGVEDASLKPQGEEGYWHLGVDDGLLYQAHLPAGSYQLATLSGSSFFKGEVDYNFPVYGQNESAVRIQKPGIYFLGSFKYQEVKTGIFEKGKFDIERADTPTELELLNKLMQLKWVKGSQWEKRIQARIAELKK
jgi:hypothetical protein